MYDISLIPLAGSADYFNNNNNNYVSVTEFAKTRHNVTRTEIQFIA